MASVDVSHTSNRLCVHDRDTRERFLVDTGADISVLAATDKTRKNSRDSALQLFAANNTPIKTYGEKTIRLNLGLRRSFTWTFIIADVKTSILGADFLRHFQLLVDLHKKKLIDIVTNLSINTIEISTPSEAIHLINSSQDYHGILKTYPNVLRPMSLKQPPKHNVVHYIETTGPPLFARARPLPPDKYKVAKEEFERMMEMGICQPSKSPWASPLHVVKKKDGGIRICGDYRRLNAVTQPDRYPIPRIQDFTYQLKDMKLFSKIDIKTAYYWIPINKEDAKKTAVITPFGLFEFNCMTFGLKNGSQSYQRFMHEVLRGISGCFCYIDDILLFSKCEESHKKLLHEILQRLEKYGVSINVDKCEFGKNTIDFLGYKVTAEGIRPPQERTDAISTYPKPKTIIELRRFLGMLNFYRDCLPHQADLQHELNKYLHNKRKNDKTPIEWTPEAENAFEKCRQSISEATTLAYPSVGNKLVIMTDASDHSLGAVLQQKDLEVWKPLAFFSKTMSANQRRYSVYDRELLAIYSAVKHFRRLIEGSEVTIYTDHKPLSYALTKIASNSDTPRRERQLNYISQFCSKIEYLKGEENTVADALSRIEEIQCPTAIDFAQLSIDQSNDEELKKLKVQPNLKFADLTLPGMSRPITCELSTTSPRPFLPKAYRYAAFKAQHELCHPGVRTTRKQMITKFFWPAMSKEVAGWTKACTECQRAKVHRHVVTPLSAFPPSQRFEHIHIDIVGPLQPSNGYRYCITIIDRCTKWPEAIPVQDITAETVTKALYEQWIARFGCPLRISTDQGRQFESSLFNTLLKKFGINRIRTTAFHPQSNGQIERWHRTMKAALMARGASITWSEDLPTVLLGLRSAIRDDNNFSPALMTYGTNLRIPSDFFVPTQPKYDDADFLRHLTEAMTSLMPTTRPQQTSQRPFVYKDLSKCSHVFVRNDTVRSPLTPPYDGPYEVLKRHEKYYKIQLPTRTSVISLDRLKPAYTIESETDKEEIPATRNTATSNNTLATSHSYVTRSGRVVKKNVRFA